MAAAAAPTYSFGLDVDAPTSQNRLGVFFRGILAIPHLLVVNILANLAQLLAFLAWVVIVITGRLPAGLGSVLLAIYHWEVRAQAYVMLLTGRYPPFAFGEDPAYPVRLWGQLQTDRRNRLSVFFRLILVIPHIIALLVLQLIALVVLLIGWIAAVITGRLPGFAHNYLAGFNRWYVRVGAYLYLLTDQYPPFSMN